MVSPKPITLTYGDNPNPGVEPQPFVVVDGIAGAEQRLSNSFNPIKRGVVGNVPGLVRVTLGPDLASTGWDAVEADVRYTRWDSPLINWITGTPEAVGGNVQLGCQTFTSGARDPKLQTGSIVYRGPRLAWLAYTYGPGAVSVVVDGVLVYYGYTTDGWATAYVGVEFNDGRSHQVDVSWANATPYLIFSTLYDVVFAGPEREMIGIDGDSYMASGVFGASGQDMGIGWHIWLQTGLAVINLAQGSTGWASQNDPNMASKEPYDGPARVAAKKAYPLKFILVVGSVNDGEFNAAVPDAVDSYLRAVAPTPVAVAGVEPLGDGTPGRAATNESVIIRAQANVAGNVKDVIDWYGEDWLTGTGWIGNPQNDGIQDWAMSQDEIHPSDNGNDYLARRLVARLSVLPL